MLYVTNGGTKYFAAIERAENDYLINLKAEIEIRHLHQKIDLSVVDQYQHLCEIQQRQIEILSDLQNKLGKLSQKEFKS